MPESDKVLMTTITDVTILEAILHIVDNSKDGNLTLSEFPLNIVPEKVNNFLKKHIIDSLRDDKIRKAKFNGAHINLVNNYCQTIISDTSLNEKVFVDNSMIIAKNLYSSMKKGNISPGYLIVCKYKDNNDNIYIAILKMDYNDYFVSDTQKIDGKIRNELVPKTNALPPLKQKLQKCAFIKKYNSGNSYDLIVLDKQTNGQEDEVAQFFYKDFLNCIFIVDITSNTKTFFYKSCAFIGEIYNEDPIKKKEKISSLYNLIKGNDTFNAKKFAENVFENEQIKNKYLQEVIINNDLVYESQIDKSFVDKKLNKVSITSKEGIEIILDSSIMGDKNIFIMDECHELPGTYNIFIKNIHIDGKDIKSKR